MFTLPQPVLGVSMAGVYHIKRESRMSFTVYKLRQLRRRQINKERRDRRRAGRGIYSSDGRRFSSLTNVYKTHEFLVQLFIC
jgi:hypothetical protein